MKRRELLCLLGGATTWPLASSAQQAGKAVRRIGFLGLAPRDSLPSEPRYASFVRGLREAGYVEGQNCIIHYRGADWQLERLARLAAELVDLKSEVIVAGTTPAARAARQATTTIPIVVALMVDPVGDGFVTSLARPSGNVTGFTTIARELAVKRLGMLREMVPSATRIAALWHRGSLSERTSQDVLSELDTAARGLKMQLRSIEVLAPDDLDRAFASMTGQVDAVVMTPNHMLFDERRRIVDLAARHRLPATYGVRGFVEVGGLFSYGADEPDLYRRAGAYTARILNGARTADLPVEQPAEFELVINVQTARALGLTVPPALRALANELVE